METSNHATNAPKHQPFLPENIGNFYISRFICQIITRGGEGIGRGASIHRYTRYTWYVYKILSWLGPIVHFYN